MKHSNSHCFTIILVLIFILGGCSSPQKNKEKNKTNSSISGELVIFHAGSLSVPFQQIADSFQSQYQQVDVKLEAAGSVDCARKITDLNKKADIMASADYKVIDELLIPDYTGWLIKFAANEMALVYDEDSKYADKINKDNWTDILLRNDVYYGRSDPDSDPCGYRTVLTAKLAESYYNKIGFAEKLLKKDKNFMRPKETDLLALLESNTLDYIFLYRSVANQHNLESLLLPDSVNLGNPSLSGHYAKVGVDIAGKKPGEKITIKGEPMVYGVTMLKNAPNPSAAKAFLKFLLSGDKGLKIMEKNGQPTIVPAKTQTYENIPEEFKQYASK
jgi:molybdate/tungstate transport system substrate-binding protein